MVERSFNVGDRVKHRSAEYRHECMRIGTVIRAKAHHDRTIYCVQFDGDYYLDESMFDRRCTQWVQSYVLLPLTKQMEITHEA